MDPDLYSSLCSVGETSLAINPVTLGSCLAPHQCSLVLSCIQPCQILWHWHRWEHLHPLLCIYTSGAERLIMSPFLSPFDRCNFDSFCLEILSWQTLKYLWPQMQMLPLFWFCPEFSNRDKRAAVTVAPPMLAAHTPTPLPTGALLCLPNRPVAPVWSCLRYFKSCRLCEGRSPSLVFPTVWGTSRALTAGKGCARLRREAWLNKSPSQDASHSRTFPAIPSILPVLLCSSYTTQCPTHICKDRGNQGSIPGASFTLHCACTAFTEPSLPTWASWPFLSHSACSQHSCCIRQEGQRFFACLVDSPRIWGDMWGSVIPLCCANSTACLESQAAPPGSHLCFAEGLHWSCCGGWALLKPTSLAGIKDPAGTTRRTSRSQWASRQEEGELF